MCRFHRNSKKFQHYKIATLHAIILWNEIFKLEDSKKLSGTFSI